MRGCGVTLTEIGSLISNLKPVDSLSTENALAAHLWLYFSGLLLHDYTILCFNVYVNLTNIYVYTNRHVCSNS